MQAAVAGPLSPFKLGFPFHLRTMLGNGKTCTKENEELFRKGYTIWRIKSTLP